MAEMDENTRAAVRKAKQSGPFTLSEAMLWFPGSGEQTVRNRLDRLVEMDILEKQGKTKGMRYLFKDPLRDLRSDESR